MLLPFLSNLSNKKHIYTELNETLSSEFWFFNYYVLILQYSGNSISEVSGFPKRSANMYQTVKSQKVAIFIIITSLHRMNENVFYETEYFSKLFQHY
jgi:hypothetical protein